MIRWTLLLLLFTLPAAGPCLAEPGIANGWRGNGTGLWPEARVPLEWERLPRGVVAGLRTCADRPSGEALAGATSLEKGLVRHWLVLGPIAVTDSVRDFSKAQLRDETTLEPTAGDKAGALVWKKLSAPIDDRWAFGPVIPPWADVAKIVGGYKRNQIAYAHAYLFAPTGGTIRAVLEHAHGLKVWLNGKEVYGSGERSQGMGNYYAFSRVELGIYDLDTSPSFHLALKPGWNRLLLKVSTYNKEGWTEQHFCLRLMDLPTVAYQSKNIRWMTELPHRSNATPLVVGDRVFVMAEPDELLCLDKETGKILWAAVNNYFELLTPAERQANPVYNQVAALRAERMKEKDFIKRQRLLTQMQRLLAKLDRGRFAWKNDDHFEAHFGVVGFTTPTPVSDGKHVWVWCGNAVAACYDLNGKRRWITRVPAPDLSYSSSPALADGTLAVYLHLLFGLDAETGKLRWEQKKIKENNGAILSARIAGTAVFVSSMGDIVAARDGKLLYREPDRIGGRSSWAPPVILGDTVYLPRYGVKQLLVLDFTGAMGDNWKPKRNAIHVPDGVGARPDGVIVDRPTAGSPLVVDGLAYLVDIYSTLYVFDVKSRKMLYHRDTDLAGLFHYNALPVAASPTLIGKHIVIQDNQGVAQVLEPGPTFRPLRLNRIATQMDRWWPIPAQETIGYSPPVPDGERIYVRGERYLYCIGAR
jgi:outer membrane protein assembly factor BamB